MPRVLVLYTGGTIGMVHRTRGDPRSPLGPANLDEFLEMIPSTEELGASIEVVCFSPPIDSSQMSPRHWLEIARTVRDSYIRFSGFVILHGTDTMAYTASALSFLFDHLDKPVMITGSQIPLESPESDGRRNLMTALRFAAASPLDPIYIPEVCICFGGKVLRGNRTTKATSSGFGGFRSPNFPELALVDERVRVRRRAVRDAGNGSLVVHEHLDSRVLILPVFPGLSAELAREVLLTTGLKGAVLEVYGAGTVPMHEPFLEVVRNARDRGVVLVATTQCEAGAAEDYVRDLGFRLRDSGVIAGQDMTTEAALAKLMFLLGNYQHVETVRELAQLDLRGEQSVSAFSITYGPGEASPLYQGHATERSHPLMRGRVENAWIRLHGLEGGDGASDNLNLQFQLHTPSGINLSGSAGRQSSCEWCPIAKWEGGTPSDVTVK